MKPIQRSQTIFIPIGAGATLGSKIFLPDIPELRDALGSSGIEVAGGRQALIEAAARPVDMTVAAIVGCAGLSPVMAAVERGGTIALANKEALVSAGEVLMQAVVRHGATLLPTDSEHNAIFQCLSAGRIEDVAKITLTASGGPLRTWTQAQLDAATPAEAVAHPNWSMGAKISVDSATMMNKGLEYIEAYHLFPVGLEKLGIVVHPQSVIHSMVEFRDRSTLAQLGPSDMRVPIASCLAWPQCSARRSATWPTPCLWSAASSSSTACPTTTSSSPCGVSTPS
jgi:1-deoxy-D-xylulose-5-phosphate reductoisomerase